MKQTRQRYRLSQYKLPASISLALTLGTLSACSQLNTLLPQPAQDPIITQLTGKSVDYAQRLLGLPHRREDSEAGFMVWVYLDNEHGNAAKNCEVSLSIHQQKIESVYISTKNASLLSYMGQACNKIRKKLTAHG